jgi:hypothetical protein
MGGFQAPMAFFISAALWQTEFEKGYGIFHSLFYFPSPSPLPNGEREEVRGLLENEK